MIIKDIDNLELPEYIIIGGGPAGITLAIQLEKKNRITYFDFMKCEVEIKFSHFDFRPFLLIGPFPDWDDRFFCIHS